MRIHSVVVPEVSVPIGKPAAGERDRRGISGIFHSARREALEVASGYHPRLPGIPDRTLPTEIEVAVFYANDVGEGIRGQFSTTILIRKDLSRRRRCTLNSDFCPAEVTIPYRYGDRPVERQQGARRRIAIETPDHAIVNVNEG